VTRWELILFGEAQQKMSDTWKIKNWITGEEVELPKSDYNEPTKEWIEGWNAAMQGDVCNPYSSPDPEWHEWNDGWWSAMED